MSGVVIKAGEVGRVTRNLCAIDLRDIAAQAETHLSSARAEAEKIQQDAKAAAEVEREKVLQAAHDEGFAAGHEEGLAAGKEAGLAEARTQFAGEQASVLATLNQLISDFDERRESLYTASRRDVVVLAVAIASRIVQRFETMNDVASQAASEACEEAISLLRTATEVVVRTHPDDAAALERLASEMASRLRSSQQLRIVEDESVGRGGVRVESAESVVDATLNTRVERVADELVTDWRRRMEELGI